MKLGDNKLRRWSNKKSRINKILGKEIMDAKCRLYEETKKTQPVLLPGPL
jgi:hypothetical protein